MLPEIIKQRFLEATVSLLREDHQNQYVIWNGIVEAYQPSAKEELLALIRQAKSSQNSPDPVRLLMLEARVNRAIHKNYPAAIELYERAIELGDSQAMSDRAYMHAEGQGGPVNYPAAIGLYERAIEFGNSLLAMSNRAYMHAKGQGGPVNYPAAIGLCERAIELGNSQAIYNRAYMHAEGLGGPVNYPAAIGLYERAIELGNSQAIYNRASMHAEGLGGPVNYPAAIGLYERAIELGNSQAIYNRASMHLKGLGGPVNYPAAIGLYERAIELGNSQAMSNRAYMHAEGQGGPVNYPAAIGLYERAIELGNSQAMSNRASMHAEGQGGSVNYPAAIGLYERAIELGNSHAMYNRAYMHAEGLGGPVNYPAAIGLYERAIELGNSQAMSSRADMHFKKIGCQIKCEDAIKQLIKFSISGRRIRELTEEVLKEITLEALVSLLLAELKKNAPILNELIFARLTKKDCKSLLLSKLLEGPDSDEKLSALNNALDPNHVLGKIFQTASGPLVPDASREGSSLWRLANARQQLLNNMFPIAADEAANIKRAEEIMLSITGQSVNEADFKWLAEQQPEMLARTLITDSEAQKAISLAWLSEDFKAQLLEELLKKPKPRTGRIQFFQSSDALRAKLARISNALTPDHFLGKIFTSAEARAQLTQVQSTFQVELHSGCFTNPMSRSGANEEVSNQYDLGL